MLVATDAIRGNDTIQNVRATAEIKLSILIVLARKVFIELNQQFYRPHYPAPQGCYMLATDVCGIDYTTTFFCRFNWIK